MSDLPTAYPYSPRETVMVKLYELLDKTALFKTVSRKLVLWAECDQNLRPAIYLHEIDDDVAGGDGGIPQNVVMHVNLFIYTWAKEAKVPATLLNPLIDAVFAVLNPSPLTGKCNLGIPFIDHCWIKGKLFKDVGDLDGDGLAIIPLSIRMMGMPLVYPK